MLNIEQSNLVFLENYNTKFDAIIITFTDQNGRPLEIEGKVNLTLLINKTASKKVVNKAAEATGEFTGNKITDKIVKPKPVLDVNSRNVE